MPDEFDWRNMPIFERPDRGALSEAGLRKFLIVRQIACESLERNDVNVHELFGCLSKLTSFLAMAASAKTIDEEMRTFSTGVAVDHPAAIAVFETVVFHAGAALDRLAVFIGSGCNLPACRATSHLYRELIEAQNYDVRAEYLFRAYCQVRPKIEGLLVGSEVNGRFVNSCLRHDLIHNASIYEYPFCPFQIESDKNGGRLFLDAEFNYRGQVIALFETIHLLIKWVSFFVLYAASVCLARTKAGSLMGHGLAKEWDFGDTIGEPSWKLEWVSAHKLQSPTGNVHVSRVTKTWPNVTREQIKLQSL